MSFDYINVLPPELLYMVFDYLDYDIRCTVSEVCQRWTEMLFNYHRPYDRHAGNRLLPIHVSLHACERQLKECRHVEIMNYRFETDWEIQCMENYFFNRDLVENLVELSIDQTLCWFGEAEMHLPNLHTLHIRFSGPLEPWDLSPEELPPMRCRIVAPKLRTFHQECSAMLEPLRMFSEQIETLVIFVIEKEDFLSAMENLRLTKVRNLTLCVRGWFGRKSFQEADFSAELRQLFGRLNHLTIDSWAFQNVLSCIIGEAKHLSSLKLNIRQIDENALLQISKLKWLEELTLQFEDEVVIAGLSQPKLTKLKTDISTIGSLSNLPCLKSLDLMYTTTAGLTSYFRPVANQLQSLRFLYFFVLLDRNVIDGICSLVNLSILKIATIKGESSDVEELFRRLDKLRIVRFQHCTLTKTIAPCSVNCDCCFCDDYDLDEVDVHGLNFLYDKPGEQRLRQFIKQLSLRFVDCSIVVSGGTLKKSG